MAVGAGERFLLDLLEGFLEALREGIAAGLLVTDRLLEQRFPARRRLGQNPLCFVELRLVLALRHTMPDDSLQMRVNSLGGTTAGADDLKFG